MRKHKKLTLVSAAVLMCVGLLVLAACLPAGGGSGEDSGNSTEVVMPSPNAMGVVTADDWKDVYPNEYATYKMNADNTARVSYIEEDPFITTLYNGMGFAKDYSSAIGHPYTLQDVGATERAHPLANCLTCKSPEMTALVNSEGDTVYAKEFEEVYAMLNEPVSCYNCHENTGDQLVVTHRYLSDALADDKDLVPLEDQVCGQCHNEYFFNGETKATTLPWSGLSQMNPDSILAFYNEMGFKDFENGVSLAPMIKVQHPEFETVLGEGNKMQGMGSYTCADCHMGTAKAEDGSEYASHNWQSPLKNATLLETCNSCHDTAAQVKAIQDETKAREVAIGTKLEALHNRIAAAAADGSKSEEELTGLRLEVRDAQFYWDFVYVENSEGAHNSSLTKQLLDKAERLADAALAKF
jgi:nitrite reductase (cytochrome c-552)